MKTPPVPIPNTEVKLVYGESTQPSKAREDSKLPDFKKAQSQPQVAVASFFATCYPTREGEQGLLKIADTRYFALRGEPTTKYSGWRCPSRHAFTLMAARKQVAGFQSKMTVFKPKTVIFLLF